MKVENMFDEDEDFGYDTDIPDQFQQNESPYYD